MSGMTMLAIVSGSTKRATGGGTRSAQRTNARETTGHVIFVPNAMYPSMLTASGNFITNR
jgi:hypothetical protein